MNIVCQAQGKEFRCRVEPSSHRDSTNDENIPGWIAPDKRQRLLKRKLRRQTTDDGTRWSECHLQSKSLWSEVSARVDAQASLTAFHNVLLTPHSDVAQNFFAGPGRSNKGITAGNRESARPW